VDELGGIQIDPQAIALLIPKSIPGILKLDALKSSGHDLFPVERSGIF
jgi:hypothetical protein